MEPPCFPAEAVRGGGFTPRVLAGGLCNGRCCSCPGGRHALGFGTHNFAKKTRGFEQNPPKSGLGHTLWLRGCILRPADAGLTK